MSLQIFVSSTKADHRYLRKIKSWAAAGKFGDKPVEVKTAEEPGLRTKKGRLIKPKIERLIKSAKVIIVLVGDFNESHPWAKFKALASDLNIPSFFMRIPYTEDQLPESLDGIPQMAYNPNAVEKWLRAELTDNIVLEA